MQTTVYVCPSLLEMFRLFSEQGQRHRIAPANLPENALMPERTSTRSALTYLLFILFPFPNDDCVKRFNE